MSVAEQPADLEVGTAEPEYEQTQSRVLKADAAVILTTVALNHAEAGGGQLSAFERLHELKVAHLAQVMGHLDVIRALIKRRSHSNTAVLGDTHSTGVGDYAAPRFSVQADIELVHYLVQLRRAEDAGDARQALDGIEMLKLAHARQVSAHSGILVEIVQNFRERKTALGHSAMTARVVAPSSSIPPTRASGSGPRVKRTPKPTPAVVLPQSTTSLPAALPNPVPLTPISRRLPARQPADQSSPQSAERRVDPNVARSLALRQTVADYLAERIDELEFNEKNPRDVRDVRIAIAQALKGAEIQEKENGETVEVYRKSSAATLARIQSLQVRLNPGLAELIAAQRSGKGVSETVVTISNEFAGLMREANKLRASWVGRAACLGSDPDTFHLERLLPRGRPSSTMDRDQQLVATIQEAVEPCSNCPVTEECGAYGQLTTGSSTVGGLRVYGGQILGLSPIQKKMMRRVGYAHLIPTKQAKPLPKTIAESTETTK